MLLPYFQQKHSGVVNVSVYRYMAKVQCPCDPCGPLYPLSVIRQACCVEEGQCRCHGLLLVHSINGKCLIYIPHNCSIFRVQLSCVANSGINMFSMVFRYAQTLDIMLSLLCSSSMVYSVLQHPSCSSATECSGFANARQAHGPPQQNEGLDIPASQCVDVLGKVT